MTQQMQIRDLAARGLSPTEIKETTGFSYPTIRKYLAKDDFSPQRPVKRAEGGILDPYKAEIARMLEEDKRAYHKQRHTARRVHRRLVDEHGFEGSYSTVQRYVRELRAQARLAAAKGPFVDLEWPAGTMQVDFGQADFEYRGKLTRMHYLAESFPQSNHGLAQLFGDERAVCVCQGMKDTFEHIGGVPPLVVFDNATEVGRRVCGEIRESSLFKAFRMHYGFDAAFANPDSGHKKGSVEGKVGWLRRNLFVPVPKVGSLKAFNAQLLAACDRCSEVERHYQRQLTWAQLFEADRMALLPLPRAAFDAVEWVACKTDGYGKVTLGRSREAPGHRYLADPALPNTEVVAGVRAYEVELGTLAGERLRTYTRRFGAGFTDDEDPVALLDVLARKARAFPMSSVHSMLAPAVQEHLDAMPQDKLREQIKTMAKVAREHGMETCAAAYEDTLAATGATSPFDVEVTAARISCVGRGVVADSGDKLIMYDDLMRRRASNG